MPLSVVELITQELKTRLDMMIDNNTYMIGVVEVIRPTRLGNYTPKDRQIVLTQGDPARIEELDYQGSPPAIAMTQEYNIRCHLIVDEQETTDIDSLLNLFASDVIRAVTQSSATWHTFDDNAIDAQFLAPQYVSADGGPDGVNVPLLVTYRVSEYDPTVKR